MYWSVASWRSGTFGVEPEPRVLPWPSNIDGMLHTLDLVQTCGSLYRQLSTASTCYYYRMLLQTLLPSSFTSYFIQKKRWPKPPLYMVLFFFKCKYYIFIAFVIWRIYITQYHFISINFDICCKIQCAKY